MDHSKIQTVFDIYGNLSPSSYHDVRERMGAFGDRREPARWLRSG
jgi:hypothetical protein